MDELASMERLSLFCFAGVTGLIDDVLIASDAFNAAIAQFNDLSTAFERCDAMGDDEQGKILAEIFDGLHDSLLCFIV
jgi:hypothetical protein